MSPRKAHDAAVLPPIDVRAPRNRHAVRRGAGSPLTRPVAGLDGCPDGWLYVLEVEDGEFEAGIAGDVAAVLRIAPDDTIVAIDIPIGLTEAGGRTCDAAARGLLDRPRHEPSVVRDHGEDRGVGRRPHGRDGRRYGVDDLHDALAALWTARRIRAGTARTFPDEPALDARGLRMAIVA